MCKIVCNALNRDPKTETENSYRQFVTGTAQATSKQQQVYGKGKKNPAPAPALAQAQNFGVGLPQRCPPRIPLFGPNQGG